jgi:CheY-like chemotaxis protein/anti-sigma regulatory factor (Ser/Thr protein kinase)
VPDRSVWVKGDSTRLAQVLTNLLENAVKFTDRPGRVSVQLAQDLDRRQAVLRVTDSGIGIERDMLPRVFEVFAQADRSLDRTRGGLGLGLALVKGLVDLHDGEVAADSEGPGRGATFMVRLPLEEEPAVLAPAPTVPKPVGPRRRILVIEDNRDGAESLRLLLELLNHDVQVAYTGPDGVQEARRWRPDVVLCDIGLPGLDGYGVATEVRRNPVTARARLIALTGYGQEEDLRRSQEAGFDRHLVKPVDPEELQRTIAAVAG